MGSAGSILRLATNNSYILEVRALHQLALPVFIFKSKYDMDDIHADDMMCGDLTKEQIKGYGVYKPFEDREFELSAREHFNRLKKFANIASWCEFSPLTERMFNRFEQNIGGVFSDALLDKAAREHENTKKVLIHIQNAFSEKIRDKQGEIDTNDINDIWYELSHGKEVVHLPDFDKNPNDWLNGLGIIVHGIWSLHLTLKDFSIDLMNRKFDGVVHFRIQDHFGLNKDDIDGGKGFELLNAFRSWFILQRYKSFGYKPFITEINHEQRITGKY